MPSSDSNGLPGDSVVQWSEDSREAMALSNDGDLIWTLDNQGGKHLSRQSESGAKLSEKASGTISFEDGSTLAFDGVEKLSW